MIGHENLVYRLGVGIVLINKAGLILVARRRKTQERMADAPGGNRR